MNANDESLRAWYAAIRRAEKHGWKWEYTLCGVAALVRIREGRRFEARLSR